MSNTSSANLPNDTSSPSDTRFSPITDHDKAGMLWIAALLAGVYAVLSMGVRSYIKRKCFGHDDWVCLAATIVGAGSFVAIYSALSQGFGKIVVHDPVHLQRIGRAVFASQIAFVVGIALAKASVTLLIKRLFAQGMVVHRRLCNILLVAVALWTVGSLISVSVACKPTDLVTGDALSCVNRFLRWKFIGVFDAITELLIILLSCGLVFRLQMRLELKLRVILAFMFRAPLVVIIALHIRYVYIAGNEDVNLDIIPAFTVGSVQLGYALISATIPNLKSFLMSFDTGMMMDIHTCPSHSHSQSHADSKSLCSCGFQNQNSNKTVQRLLYSNASTQAELIGQLRPDWKQLEHRADAHHVSDAEAEIDHLPLSSERESQHRDIRVDYEWCVDEEAQGVPRFPRDLKR